MWAFVVMGVVMTASVPDTLGVRAGATTTMNVKLTNSGDATQHVDVDHADIHLVERDIHATVEPKPVALDLAPRSSAYVTFTLTAIDDVGEYKGDLEIPLGDKSPPAFATITVDVQRSVWWAVGAIAVGIVVGMVVAYVRERLQPRLAARLALMQSLSRLDAIGPRGESVATAKTRLRAQGREIDARIRGGEIAKDAIVDLDRRVGLVGAANDDLGRVLDLALPLDVAHGKLATIDDALALATGGGSVDDGLAKLRSLALDAANRDNLTATYNALQTSANEHERSTDPALAIAVGHDVRPLLDRASEALRANDDRAAVAAMRAARVALAAAGTRSIIAALDDAPAWVDAARWKAFADDLRKRIRAAGNDPDRYEDIRDAYVAGLESLLVAAASEDDGKRQALAADLADVRNASHERAKRGERSAALRKLERALAPAGSPGARLAVAAPAPDAGVLGAAELPAIAAGLPPAPDRKPAALEWPRLAREAQLAQVGTAFVTFVLAALAGVQALWVGHATWGSSADLLTAFAWGAGAKASTDIVTSLAWIRSATTKP